MNNRKSSGISLSVDLPVSEQEFFSIRKIRYIVGDYNTYTKKNLITSRNIPKNSIDDTVSKF